MTRIGIRRRLAACLICALTALISLRAHAASDRLDRIRQRGFLTCGYEAGVLGFAWLSPGSGLQGLDIDTCRAFAAAIFADPARVRFIPASSVTQLDTMPELDVVVRRLTWTLTREAAHGLIFGPITFYDGQGFMTPRSAGVTHVGQLAGRRICVDPGEDWAGNLLRYGKTGHLEVEIVVTAGPDDSQKRLSDGRCDAYSADISMLASVRASHAHAGDWIILPETISKEPLAPLLRRGDDRFFQVVRWTVFAMIEAEELGVTSKNVHAMRSSSDPAIARLLGVIPGNGRALGLDETWACRVIETIGNYGEMFDRNVGAESQVRLDRGLDDLWTRGGLMYAPPLR